MSKGQWADTVWTRHPGAIERIRTLWTVDGLPMSAIAATVSKETGMRVTRSMIGGRLQRLGLIGQGGTYTRPENGAVVPHEPIQAGITLPMGYRYIDGRLTVGGL